MTHSSQIQCNLKDHCLCRRGGWDGSLAPHCVRSGLRCSALNCVCVRMLSPTAWTRHCLLWWDNWALHHSPSWEGTEHIYMVSCVCKAAHWHKDNRPALLKRTVCGPAGTTHLGPWDVGHQLGTERQSARCRQSQHLPPQDWAGPNGRVGWGDESCKRAGEDHCKCLKIKARFGGVVFGCPLKVQVRVIFLTCLSCLDFLICQIGAEIPAL